MRYFLSRIGSGIAAGLGVCAGMWLWSEILQKRVEKLIEKKEK